MSAFDTPAPKGFDASFMVFSFLLREPGSASSGSEVDIRSEYLSWNPSLLTLGLLKNDTSGLTEGHKYILAFIIVFVNN